MTRKKTNSDKDDDGIFEMEEVLDYKKQNKEDFYLVKWRGYSVKESTWEPIGNIINPFSREKKKMKILKKRWLADHRSDVEDNDIVSDGDGDGDGSDEIGENEEKEEEGGKKTEGERKKKSNRKTFSCLSSSGSCADDNNELENVKQKDEEKKKKSSRSSSTSSASSTKMSKNSYSNADYNSQNKKLKVKKTRKEAAKKKLLGGVLHKKKRNGRENTVGDLAAVQNNSKKSCNNKKFHASFSTSSSRFAIPARVIHIKSHENKRLQVLMEKPKINQQEETSLCWFDVNYVRRKYSQELLDYLLARLRFRNALEEN